MALLVVCFLSWCEGKITSLSNGYHYIYVPLDTLQWGLLAHFGYKTLFLASPHAPAAGLEVLQLTAFVPRTALLLLQADEP